MRRNATWLALAALVLLSAGAAVAETTKAEPRPAADAQPATAHDPHLSAEERAELVELLERSKAEFDRLVEGVEGEAWNYRSAPDKWSVAQVAEHLVLAEGTLFGVVQTTLESEPDPDWATTQTVPTSKIVAALGDRSQKFQAPERVTPQGDLSRDEILERFAEAREKTLAFVRETDAPIQQHTSENPLLGKANAAQWVVFLAGHNLRHNQQLAEIKADPGFPG